MPRWRRFLGWCGLSLIGTSALCACGDGGGAPAPSSFTIGGSIVGLGKGDQVVLLDNGGDSLTVTANGTFTFATALMSSTAYAVTVKTVSAGQTCTVAKGSGTVSSA